MVGAQTASQHTCQLQLASWVDGSQSLTHACINPGWMAIPHPWARLLRIPSKVSSPTRQRRYIATIYSIYTRIVGAARVVLRAQQHYTKVVQHVGVQL